MGLNNGGLLSNGASGQGFATQVQGVQAIGIEGDFAVVGDPYQTLNCPGQSGWVAGELGVNVGAFAWADYIDNTLDNFGIGVPQCFIGREQQGIFTTYSGAYAFLNVPAGLPVTGMQAASKFVRNSGSVAAVTGMKAYALNASGLVTFNVTGTPPTGATATAATLAKIVSATTGGALPTTNTCTASIAANVMTVTAVGSGSVLGAGQTITGTGIDPAETVSIVAQLTGTAGSTGTYQVSVSFGVPVASTTVTMSGGGLTLTGANTTGIFAVGMTITGTNIPAGTVITGYGTGTAGGAGTYTTNQPATTAATASTITSGSNMFLTVDASSTGVWALNDPLTGANVATQSILATGAQNANLTGMGGAGTYLTNAYQASALTSQTIGVQAGTETTWVAQSSGAPGELVVFKNSANI